MFLGEHANRVHVHNLLKNSSYLATLQSIEARNEKPLSCDDPEFQCLDTEWIHEPGIHVGICEEEIIFLVKIRYMIIISSPHHLLPVILISQCMEGDVTRAAEEHSNKSSNTDGLVDMRSYNQE